MDNHQDKFKLIFQRSLEFILRGQETIESVVTRNPEFSNALRLEVEASLWLKFYGDNIGPQPGLVAASRRRLGEPIKREGGLIVSPERVQNNDTLTAIGRIQKL